MKYKHEFAIKHLPQFIMGGILISIGGIGAATMTYFGLTGAVIPAGGWISLIYMMLFGWAIGAIILSDGIEYTTTLHHSSKGMMEEHNKTKRPSYDPWESDENRRARIAGYDFTPSPVQVEAAKKQDIKNQLKAEVFGDD